MSHLKIVSSLLCLFAFFYENEAFGQVVQSMNSSDFESEVNYTAEDSLYFDLKNEQLHLYGNAHLDYEGISMNADYILVDLKSKEIRASYTTDSSGRQIGAPVFVQDGDTINAGKIIYNYESEKGFIEDVAIKQDEYYLSMGTAKKQQNGEIHFINGKFTTCNLEDPHFHFRLSKAVLVPDKRIVTGPINLHILGVPTPIGLPFAVIPLKTPEERKSGFILPQFSVFSPYGMGFLDLGYHVPINDRFQTTFYGTLYSRGSVGLRNVSEYAKVHKFKGQFELGYTRFRLGWPNESPENQAVVRWSHTQDQKANPNWGVGINVNFNSQSSNKSNLQVQQTAEFFNNTLNSDVRVDRRFGTKPFAASLKLSMRQNTQGNRIDLASPIINFQTTQRIFPFKKINKIIGFNYGFEGQNLSNFNDSLLKKPIDTKAIADKFKSGVKHTVTLNGTLNLFRGKIRLSPNANYNQVYNLQQVEKIYNIQNQLIDSLRDAPGFSHSFNMGTGLSTTLYSMYKFIGKKQTLLRHIATPTVNFTYNPAIEFGMKSFIDTLGKELIYNSFSGSVYSQSNTTSSGRLIFGLNNTFELKQKSNKDTITGFKKTKLIDNFFLNTDYDLFKDSMKWGDLNARLVINPSQLINITLSANHSFYAWDTISGVSLSTYAFKNKQGIGRLKNASVSTQFTFAPKDKRNELNGLMREMQPIWNPIYQDWLTNPSQLIYFDIPWRLSVSHILSIGLNTNQQIFKSKRYLPNNTLQVNGDASITENWKVSSTLMYDANSGKISNLSINLIRNLHCWNAGFTWIPIGTNQSFMISLRGNASILQNANINLRRPPLVF